MIDGAADTVITTVVVGDAPRALVYNATDDKIYCANAGVYPPMGGPDSTISVIDGVDDTVLSTITVGIRPCALAYNWIDGKVYSANTDDSTVTVIDCALDTVIASIVVGNLPTALIYNSTNNKVYCANINSDDVTVIDGTGDTIVTTVAVGSHPFAFAWNHAQNRTYVANQLSSSISVLRDSTVGITESKQELSPLIVNIYPSPAKTSLVIHSSRPLSSIKLYNVLGQLLSVINLSEVEEKITIHTKDLCAGVYFVKAITEETESIRKVIVTK